MNLVTSSWARGRWALPLVGLLLVVGAQAQAAIAINEIRTDMTGTDTDEYFELTGNPGESLAGLTYIVIGDGTGGCGVIENVTALTGNSIQPDGFFAVRITPSTPPTPVLTGYDLTVVGAFENSDNVTHLLVSGFTGASGNDLDTNDDGVLDVTPWTAIVDGVAIVGTATIGCAGTAGTSEYTYYPTTVGPDGSFVPGHVLKCGGAWVVGLFTVGTDDTVGAPNFCAPQIENLLHRPFVVNPSEAATVTADVTDPDGTVASVTLFYRLNGGPAFTSTAMTLGVAPSYSGTIPGQALGTLVEYYVQAQDNNGGTSVSPPGAPTTLRSYTVANDNIITIASIHANLGTLTGTQVQIQAQVYIPGNYKGPGNTTSAYVQDGSGRGLNIFGDTNCFGQSTLNDVTNIVQITGTVSVFGGTTVELTPYEAVLVSTGNPALTPALQASTLAASSPNNEGTYIQSSGVITTIAVSGGAHNFTIDDGSGAVVVRVDDDLRPDLDTAFAVGNEIYGRGAGSTFSAQGQILVGAADGIGLTGGDPPPLLNLAVLTAANQVTLTFNESIDPITGNVPGNYTVFQTAVPGNTIAVSTAAVQVPDTQVLLTLAANVPANVPHTVRVNNVEDLGGNPIAPNTEAPILDPNLGVGAIQITEIMQNPFCNADNVGEWVEVRNIGATAIDLDGWTLRDAGTESHVINNGGPLMIAAGAHGIIARDRATLEGQGLTVLYQDASLTLGNADDEVILVNPAGTTVDEVDYTGLAPWPTPNGSSMQWNESGDNNDGTNWATGGHVFGCGDTGTPGGPYDPSTPAPPLPVGITKLFANVPNPFNPSTKFQFSLAQREHATLAVYNARGQRVRTVVDDVLEAGAHTEFVWDGRNDAGLASPSGIYFFQLSTASGHSETRKMALVK